MSTSMSTSSTMLNPLDPKLDLKPTADQEKEMIGILLALVDPPKASLI
jgi:hypothetical protein